MMIELLYRGRFLLGQQFFYRIGYSWNSSCLQDLTQKMDYPIIVNIHKNTDRKSAKMLEL